MPPAGKCAPRIFAPEKFALAFSVCRLKNNRPKSDEKDLKGLVQNFSQKLEPAAKKSKKTVGKIDFIRSHDPKADAALDFLDMEIGRER